ncbi:SusD-like protein BACOVA_02651 [Pedobacter sp. Bi27]|uniref:RagB/SusD family nutrient uptake outer membrane protein n=1 Tax=unclassified Pedobacter TaxID=2628915 RepID=UPI001DB4ADAC|nr:MULTISPECIES: RagB/SusD family nutrient uptake outer membrane protein [unclassified Pedobacter]CAH0219237.1 SusD-like protein BACOVA_02651 [Pedobacter sp. Bi27]CAH0232600.1 SusD-like protein BACOVA_02651 [Pedobacter sp. Bi36]CAH0259376.1 SusD-like protein BACOVA_02651 [Pedobacter sp. Bi126]
MKNIIKKLSILITILIIVTTSACKKLLYEEPKDAPYEQTFWKNSKDVRSAMAGNYALLRNAITDKSNRYYMYGDAIAKNYFTIQYTGDGLEGIQNGDFTFQYNLNSLANYTLYYKSIAMSNLILSKVGAMTNSQLSTEDDPTEFKNNTLGQAYFLRALSYFMMVRVWGDVPVVTQAYEDPLNAPQLPRTPKAEVMKLIEDDCHKAINLLGWTYANSGDAKVTANKGSTYALLAHLYLWRATMSNVATDAPNLVDVNSADTTINTLISRGGYALTDTANYKNTFIGRSTEGIFEINVSENTLEGSNSSVGGNFLNETYVKGYGNNPRYYVVPSYFNNFYTDTDIRYKKGFDVTLPDKPMCIKYSNVIYRNPGQKLNPYLSNNIIIFRLADMMLLKAEIALYKGDVPTAINIINTFRKRNDPNPVLVDAVLSRDEVMDEYITERSKEMFLEGHLFYDLLRTRKYSNVVEWLPVERFRKEGYYWPVDPALFRNNPLLKQTTYWLGKV